MTVFKFVVAAIFMFVLSGGAQAKPYLVFDYKTGEIYAHHNSFDRWYPASLTKLMTVYTVFKQIETGLIAINSPVRISENALSMPPSKMGFPVGTLLNFDNALKIIMVKSSNDISVAIAESAAGTEQRFIDLMNMHAARLGMKNSSFKNPHGLHDEEQYTSARDMGVLAKAIIDEFPQYTEYFNISAIKLGRTTLRNHNRLVHKLPGIRGMKTGFTCPSGLNVVVSRDFGNKSLIAVVMGHATGRARNIKAAELLDAALKYPARDELGNFDEFAPKQIVNAAPNIRSIVCKKQKRVKRPSQLAQVMLLFSNPFESIEDKEARLYASVDDMSNIAQVGLGKAQYPDPFALLRDSFKPLDGVIPQLANFDGSTPLQPQQYNEALKEIEEYVVLGSANFKIPAERKLPVPIANPEREERLAISRHSNLVPQLSFPDASAPNQPQHYLDQIWDADWEPIQNRSIYALKDGNKVTIPAFKQDFLKKLEGNEG